MKTCDLTLRQGQDSGPEANPIIRLGFSLVPSLSTNTSVSLHEFGKGFDYASDKASVMWGETQ